MRRKKREKGKKIYLTLHRYNFVGGATHDVVPKAAYLLHAVLV
jgi:hypothetical protein